MEKERIKDLLAYWGITAVLICLFVAWSIHIYNLGNILHVNSEIETFGGLCMLFGITANFITGYIMVLLVEQLIPSLKPTPEALIDHEPSTFVLYCVVLFVLVMLLTFYLQGGWLNNRDAWLRSHNLMDLRNWGW